MIRWKFDVHYLWFLVHLLSIVLSSKGADVQYKGKTVIQMGKPFTIECRISVFDYPKWTKDGYEIVPSDGFQLSERKDGKSHLILTLHVNETKDEHSGYYRCNSFSREAHKISILFLDPEDDDDFSDEDESDSKSSVVLKVNQTLKVYCNLPKDEAFPVLWFKDNFRLLPGKNPNLVIKDRFLTIKKATILDAGEYMCTSTDVNTLSKPAVSSPNDVIGHITSVKYPAEVEPLPEKRLKEGDDLILECKVHGSPVPRVKWLIGNIDPEILGNVMPGFENLELLENENGLPNAILYLPNVTANHQGLYTCKAQNSLKIDEASVFVTIMDNLIQTNEKEPGSGIILEPNKPLVLQCNVTDPNVENDLDISWRKDNTMISNDVDSFKSYKTNNSLVINNPNEKNHTGLYMCVFSEANGVAYANATIDVSTKPTVEPFHKSLNLVQGDRLTLNCKYGGIPSPDIKWLKDGLDINITDTRISIHTDKETKISTLKIEDLDYPDRAEYMCQVSMKEDITNTTILVRVKDRLAALWPFLGIVAEVAILCTIIFVYEKKRAKPEFDDADTDHTADKKNIQDQKEGHDVRQRK